MESRNLLVVRAGIALLTLGLTVTIIWAGFNANFLVSFRSVAAEPWGLVALADLYFGFVLFAGIIVIFDGIKLASLIWVVVLFCGGNIVSAVWLLLRMPKLMAIAGIETSKPRSNDGIGKVGSFDR